MSASDDTPVTVPMEHLEQLVGSRWARVGAVAKWLGPLVIALAGAVYAAGVRQGLSTSAAAEHAADRRLLEQLQTTVRRLELNVSNLRGTVRAPWGPAPGDELP